MNKGRSRTLPAIAGAICLLLILTQPALADGIVIVEPPIPEDPAYLEVKYHRVTVTIENQVATTHVDQVFVNPSRHQLEGTYVFPLPQGAAIHDLSMWVDGERLGGEMLPAADARRIYEDIVRRQRDPALLEYIGRNTFRARIFPIPPHSEKRVEIEYSQVLPADKGLIGYRYPLDTERFSPEPIEDVSIQVHIRSQEAIRAVYSPSHDVAIDRPGEREARVGYEDVNVLPDSDFELYYTVAEEDIGLNLLSYRSEDEEDGFWLLLLAPQVEVERAEVVEKDVVLVLDTSGSMRGEKLAQAKRALSFVLGRLNEGDRFNIVSFSTGVRSYDRRLVEAFDAERAERWVQNLEAKGGTDINRAMLEALSLNAGREDMERPTIVIFCTDGLATEGETDTDRILRNVNENAPPSTRIFTFGVGDDVNTLLLDRMARDHRGASAYVRPGQSIEEEVSAFYAKVSTPLLSDLDLDFGGIHVQDTYPYPLPDLFAGTQIVMVGRYRAGGETTITLRGTVNDKEKAFAYDEIDFARDDSAGADLAFLPRLWATRKVGYLLNQIRLHGESQELVDEIVDLAVRYGIMTPYTSFLVNEDADLFTDRGRQEIAEREYGDMAAAPPMELSGKAAVDRAEGQTALEESTTSTGATGERVRAVRDKAFVLREGVWVDTTYDPARLTPLDVGFMSDDYFDLIAARPEWGSYFGLGERVLVVLDGQAYRVVGEGEGGRITLPTAQPTPEPAPPTVMTTPQAAATDTIDPIEPTSRNVFCRGAPAATAVALLAALLFARRR